MVNLFTDDKEHFKTFAIFIKVKLQLFQRLINGTP